MTLPLKEGVSIALNPRGLLHDGSWTEIEGHTVAYVQAWMAGQGQFVEPSLFNLVHANGGAG